MYVYLPKIKMICCGRFSAVHCINEILRLSLPKLMYIKILHFVSVLVLIVLNDKY